MSSPALNQVYKTAIVATEEAILAESAVANAVTLQVRGNFMTSTPFVVGQEYTIRDEQFLNDIPNAERIQVTNIDSLVAEGIPDGIGYAISGTIGIAGCTTNGFTGGLVNSYSTAAGASILTPGVEMAIQKEDFNCRFKTLTDAPKIDFDDEASRFATGDEGRDQAIAGARSGEITFTQKLAWAGQVYVKPVWTKLMRAMGHIFRRNGKGIFTNSGGYATLDTFIAEYGLGVNDKFFTNDGVDIDDGSLATAKARAVVQGDSFVVTAVSPAGAITYIGCAGVEFLPHPWANEETATIWIIAPENGMNPASTVWRYRGAHGGNGSSIGASKIGDVYMLTGKFNAAYVGTIELSNEQARVLTSPETNIPEILINNICTMPAVYGVSTTPSGFANFTALKDNYGLVVGSRFYTSDGLDTSDSALTGVKYAPLVKGDSFVMTGASTFEYVPSTKELEISQFNLDFGGVVNPFIDQSTSTGNAYFATQDREPKLTVNPYHLTMSKDDLDFVVTNQICGPVRVASAITNPHITIKVPNAQLLNPAIASREGYINTNRTYRALRNNLGNDALDITLPDGVMYSILIGEEQLIETEE